ncbi:MAG: hypothetical protein ACTS3F_02280 [Phycisphaerales bacterium]
MSRHTQSPSNAHPLRIAPLAPLAAHLAIAIAIAITTATTAHAAVLAYEPFSYGPNPALGEYALGDEGTGVNVIGGQNPTIGPTPFYSGPWIQSGGDSQVVKPIPSLSFPGFAPGKGGVQQETVQFACCTFGRSGRAIAGGLGTGPARTIYQSFLINFGTHGDDDPAQFGYRGHELWNGGVGIGFTAVDLFINSFAGISDLTLQVTTASGTTTVPVDGGGLDLDALAGTHLVVIRYDFKTFAPDTVTLYLDPTPGLPEPVNPEAEVIVLTSDLLITHQGAYTQFTFSGSTHTPGAIDEIRWGDTYEDVTPTQAAGTCLGDLNNDGLVNSDDLTILLSAFGDSCQ